MARQNTLQIIVLTTTTNVFKICLFVISSNRNIYIKLSMTFNFDGIIARTIVGNTLRKILIVRIRVFSWLRFRYIQRENRSYRYYETEILLATYPKNNGSSRLECRGWLIKPVFLYIHCYLYIPYIRTIPFV